MTKCQVCQKQAYFNCSKCQKAYYCSKDHQINHWKELHKHRCIKRKEQNDELLNQFLKKRYFTRKQFYDNYSNQVFDQSLIDAKVMVNFDKKIKNSSLDEYDEFEYAASVCALCRSYLLISDKDNARIVLQNYLNQSNEFLFRISHAIDINSKVSSRQRQIFTRKMNLLSSIANLSYALELDCMKYYVLYTKHIQQAFGKESYESSNCYFLIGCYFSQEGFFKKAVACFMKSAVCRGSLAGDCYFNIGVLSSLQKKYSKALEMFRISYHLRNQQYGEDSEQLAQVNENMGIIYLELNDFITAFEQFELAYNIRQCVPYSDEFNNVMQLIDELYEKLCHYIASDKDEIKKISIFLNLKQKIQNQPKFKKDRFKKQKENADKKDDGLSLTKVKSSSISGNAPLTEEQKIQSEHIMRISTSLMQKLNSTQLFMLSDLQLELSSAPSLFAKVFTIGKSMFLQKITPENMATLRAENPVLFQRIRIEQLEKKQKRL